MRPVGLASTERVMVVDDDAAMCRLLESCLSGMGLEPISFNNADDALQRFSEGDLDVVISDVRMRGMSGLSLCARIADKRPDVPVIVITAFGSMDTAVEAIRAGAHDFITKPFDLDRIRVTVDRALRQRRLRRRLRQLDAQDGAPAFGGLVGSSAEMQRVYDLVTRVAETETSVFIEGESGTGKELVARALHDRSGRRGAFVALNCAAMPRTLIESELFGHLEGAFTDARKGRSGLLDAAREGTLFLDEVGELPLDLQPKLLRALQERVYRPLGGDRELPMDARIIAATNHDLATATQTGRFRLDLYYRLHVIAIEVPPLRSRGEDVLLLARHFIERFSTATNKRVLGMTAGVAKQLLAYPWPGNVRELQNAIERAVTLTQSERITVDDLPQRIADHVAPLPTITTDDGFPTLDEVERQHIMRVYESTAGNKSKTAKILGMNRKTLYRKLTRYGVIAGDDAGA
ncbi:MAG: sigma-54-dependent Fis family transcriptional regulator [Myxococcales bacterium]|nr:sigma-54-dependent Fis family transcriptional regulator [Myxococcales bacterium]